MDRHERLARLAIALAATALVAAACAPQARPAPAAEPPGAAQSTAPAAPAPTPTASPQVLEITGRFALEPMRGPWGTKVTATASGLKPATQYDLIWTTVEGSWKLSADRSEYKGREYKSVEKLIHKVTTDGLGGFRVNFTIPEDFGYQHDVMVVDSQKIVRNKAGFDVEMEVRISPTSGPVGTPITVEVRGVGWRSYENSFQLSYDNGYTGWLSSVTTKGYARAVIPATGRPGTHYITVGHSEFGAPYLNPQQQPVVASRPFPHIPFVVTDGPAVLPPPAAQQIFPILPAKPVEKGIWTSPGGALVGAPVTLFARALPAESDIDITWSTMVGNRSVTGFQQKITTLGKTRTDAAGAFRWDFKVPDDLGGAHEVTAKIGETVVAKTSFFIQTNAFPLSVDRGPSGTKVSVHLKGAGWTETEQIYHLVYDNAFAGYACAFQSAGDIEIFLVVSGDPGWHYIDLYPGIYRGTETRPANYKMPQLTAAEDHPGEPMPIFRWAFFITAP